VTNHPTTPAADHPGRLRRAWSTLTRSAPTTPDRPDPVGTPRFVDWSGLGPRIERLRATSDRAVELAATYQPTGTRPTKPKRSTDRLRYLPPVAALGTAFVLQTIAVTDVVGGALVQALAGSDAQWLASHAGVGYLAGLALGVAVACCAEGGAAYLMDLYDKHLLARDSVWMLRLGMAGYVAASGAAIHWWTTYRHLPTITSWLLAGMSGSALFLWSRGSRWRNRVAMRAAGQLDPALPKLPAQAKLLHPVRWLVTMYLVSWEPAATTDEARARYAAWHRARADRRAAKKTDPVKPTTTPEATNQAADHSTAPEPTTGESAVEPNQSVAQPTTHQPPGPAPTNSPSTTRPAAKPSARPVARSPRLHVVGSEPAAVANARALRARYGDQLPDSIRQIRTATGWSKQRADKAVEAYRAGTDLKATDDEPTDRALARAGAN